MSELSSKMICCVYLSLCTIVILFCGQHLLHPHRVTDVSEPANNPEITENSEIHEVFYKKMPFSDLTRPYHRQRRSEEVIEPSLDPHKVRGTSNDTSPCSISTQDSEVTVNCSYLSLKILSPSWFPSNTKILRFDGNYLKTIKNYSFLHLNNLRFLSLRENEIKKIEVNAFKGLNNLQILDLYYNRIDFSSDSIPYSIFSPLTNLKTLNVVQNFIYTVCHDTHFFLPLINLERLTLDVIGDHMHFGKEFRNLTKLSYLAVSGYAQFMTDNTFENLASLKELVLENMHNIKSMSNNTFSPLINLSSLTIDNVLANLQLFHVFQGRNMSLIYFNGVSMSLTERGIKAYGSLKSYDIVYMINICVKKLIVKVNEIFVIYPSVLNNLTIWDNCLEYLQITGNPLVMSNFTVLLKLFRLTNLKTLVLSTPKKQCYDCYLFGDDYGNRCADNNFSFRRNSSNQHVRQTFFDHPRNNPKKSETTVVISPSIRRIILSLDFMFYFTNIIKFIGAENVEYLDISGNYFVEPYNVSTIVDGLQSLKSLKMAGNILLKVSESFFDRFPALEYLNISNCFIKTDVMAANRTRIFSKLACLKTLDLSYNSLYLLSPNTFSVNSTNLQRLILSHNQFRKIPFKLSHTPNLIELDLTFNTLNYLDKLTTQELDLLATKPNGFTLRLSGNVLYCGCQNIQFLQWMMQTKVRFDQNENFTCINIYGQLAYTANFVEMDSFWRKCVGQMYLTVALILLCVYVIGFLSVFLILKHKTLIRSTVLQLLGGFKLHTKEDYDIGVYIGYADADYRFPCTRLREYIEDQLQMSTYISHRDLLPSSYKASAIVDAINSSWRILLVCSLGFLQDDQWSMFSMRSAIYSQTPANPTRVLVLVLKQYVHQLPTELLAAVSEYRIIVVDRWEMDYRLREKLRLRLNEQ